MASNTPFHPAAGECSEEVEAAQSLGGSGESEVGLGLVVAATEVC
jgi:hypothetical protein